MSTPNPETPIDEQAPPRYSWTQPCCTLCWNDRYPNRPPVRLIERDEETCVYCGCPTHSGIYVREDPATAPHPTLTKEY